MQTDGRTSCLFCYTYSLLSLPSYSLMHIFSIKFTFFSSFGHLGICSITWETLLSRRYIPNLIVCLTMCELGLPDFAPLKKKNKSNSEPLATFGSSCVCHWDMWIRPLEIRYTGASSDLNLGNLDLGSTPCFLYHVPRVMPWQHRPAAGCFCQ